MAKLLSILAAALIGLGILQAHYTFAFNVMVGDVVNLQALQMQVMSLILGCTSFIAGILLAAAGCIVSRLPRS